jgi:hypothetical protein
LRFILDNPLLALACPFLFCVILYAVPPKPMPWKALAELFIGMALIVGVVLIAAH